MNIIVKDVDVSRPEETIVNSAQLAPHAFKASSFLKAFGHEGRLMILWHLSNGEKTVTELQKLLSAPQALVSSQLARLRHEGMVAFRKDGQTNHYRLKDQRTRQILGLVNTIFCRGLKDHK